MKLGEGGEAFFVFETTADVPENLQTSPLVSPATSPTARPVVPPLDASFQDLEPLDLASDGKTPDPLRSATLPVVPNSSAKPVRRGKSEAGSQPNTDSENGGLLVAENVSETPSELPEQWLSRDPGQTQQDAFSTEDVIPPRRPTTLKTHQSLPGGIYQQPEADRSRSRSPGSLAQQEALSRAITLSKKLWSSNIPSHVNDEGDLMLDMTGYKSSDEDSLRAEVIARQLLSEELEGNCDIGGLIGADEKGNLWIYSSEEAKEAAARKFTFPLMVPTSMSMTDAISDPGYQSDDNQSQQSLELNGSRLRRESDTTIGLRTPPDSPTGDIKNESNRSYAKTLRLASDQLKAMDLKPGPNPISFSVNRATCQANIYLWRYDVPIVISDVDGTITK